MDKKELLINENVSLNQNQAIPPTSEADLLYAQSLSLLNNAIEECQLDGFQTVESTVPQIFDQQGLMTNSSKEETDFFSLAKQLFEQQAPLFSIEDIEQQELASSLVESLNLDPVITEHEQNALNQMPENQEDNLQLEQQLEKPIESTAELPVDRDAGLDAINELLNSG
jgi:hypothetical protein